jgi:hypothetical protein
MAAYSSSSISQTVVVEVDSALLVLVYQVLDVIQSRVECRP